jgi:hypothetical protein
MRKTQFTDFVLKHLKWTGFFIYKPVFFGRLKPLIIDISKVRKNEKELEAVLLKNPDIVDGFEIKTEYQRCKRLIVKNDDDNIINVRL